MAISTVYILHSEVGRNRTQRGDHQGERSQVPGGKEGEGGGWGSTQGQQERGRGKGELQLH